MVWNLIQLKEREKNNEERVEVIYVYENKWTMNHIDAKFIQRPIITLEDFLKVHIWHEKIAFGYMSYAWWHFI